MTEIEKLKIEVTAQIFAALWSMSENEQSSNECIELAFDCTNMIFKKCGVRENEMGDRN